MFLNMQLFVFMFVIFAELNTIRLVLKM